MSAATNIAPITVDGVALFLADLEAEGLEPEVHGTVVTYCVIPATGGKAGQSLRTGVSTAELQGWPMVPPHWVHAPADVTFAHTNVDAQECLPGWQRHSRDIGPWDMNRKPIHHWLAHVRAVLGQAV